MSTPRKPTPTLPALDLEAIKAESDQWVAERLAEAPDLPSLIQAATRIMDSQQRPKERLAMQRDKAALSIREYGPDATEPIPKQVRNVRLAEAAGISRPRLQTLRNQWPATAGAVPLVPNARRELPRLARKCAMHQYRFEAARIARDAAVDKLIEQGWKNADIARLMSRDPSRVAHLRARHGQLAS